MTVQEQIHARILHDAVHVGTINVLEVIENLVPADEVAQAYEEIYKVGKAMIEAYVLQTQRREERLHPKRDG